MERPNKAIIDEMSRETLEKYLEELQRRIAIAAAYLEEVNTILGISNEK